jgi:hypothetical protein
MSRNLKRMLGMQMRRALYLFLFKPRQLQVQMNKPILLQKNPLPIQAHLGFMH